MDLRMEKTFHICPEESDRALTILIEAFKNGNKLLTCGNGGSASDAEHIVGELMKKFIVREPIENEFLKEMKVERAFPSICLNSQTSILTAIGNDIGYDYIFSQQVFGYGKEGDVLIALSTSGNSKNVVNAAKMAKFLNMKVISVTGQKDSLLSQISDVTIKMPSSITHEIQEDTLKWYHWFCHSIELNF